MSTCCAYRNEHMIYTDTTTSKPAFRRQQAKQFLRINISSIALQIVLLKAFIKMSAKKEKKEKKKYKQEGEDEDEEDGREIKLSLTKKQGKLKSFIMLTNDKRQINADIPSSMEYSEDFIPLKPLNKSTQVTPIAHFL